MGEMYYISNTAYQGLVRLAITHGFVREKNKSKFGLSHFLTQLSFCEFSDTRPEHIQAIHIEMLKREIQPKWSLSNELKLPRNLTLSNEIMMQYADTAYRLGIVQHRRLVNGGQTRNTITSITSNVLEAIGLHWITPTSLPKAKTSDRRVQRVVIRKKPKSTTSKAQTLSPHLIFIKRGNGRTRTDSRAPKYNETE